METGERIVSAYNRLKDAGIISSRQNVAEKRQIEGLTGSVPVPVQCDLLI